MMPEIRVAGPRTSAMLVWCSVASLGLLFTKASTVLRFAAIKPRLPVSPNADAIDFLPYLAPALALVVWHLFPRRSWTWLLLAGGLLALPVAIIQVATGIYHPWMAQLLSLTVASAPAFTLVGIMAAATWMWQSGRQRAGGALIGMALMMQVVGPIVVQSTGAGPYSASQSWARTFAVLTLILVVVAIIGAVGAIWAVRAVDLPARSPDWRVTIMGGLAAAAPVVAFLWQPAREQQAIVDHYLYLGMIFVLIGLIVGAVAGCRALLTAAAAGLILGTFGMLIAPAAEILRQLPVIGVIAAIVSLALGYGAALSRWRVRFGTWGLGIVAMGLAVLLILFDRENPRDYEEVAQVMTPVLLVIGIVAAIAAISGVGSVLAAHSEPPAVLVGLTSVCSLATIMTIGYFTVSVPDRKAPIVGLLPPAIVCLLLGASLAGFVVLRLRGSRYSTIGDRRVDRQSDNA